MAASFYWHDYETWGADPRRDLPCQFAGLRTDADLNEIGEPQVLFCRPPTDRLPDPEACLITGITPQRAAREGLREAEFAARIHEVLSLPGTCGVGYNSIRFDDEFTRHLFHRTLRDPYAREWRDGNSRWDLIDVVRLAHALRPDGLEWPLRPDGTASFRLEHLTAANGIDHGAAAHEALADVRATLALARRLRAAQPRLFDYALTLRDKRQVRRLFDAGQPLLHVSARYPASLGCIAPILPLAPHPSNPNGLLCWDLRADPLSLLERSVEALRAALFAPANAGPTSAERPPIKTVHLNRSPMLAPLKTLTPDSAARWSIDPDAVLARAAACAAHRPALRERVQDLYRGQVWPAETDPERTLHGGPFLSDRDRQRLEALHALDPVALAQAAPDAAAKFEDARLPVLLFRYRARNWPETLTPDERETWDAHRFLMLTDPEGGASLTLDRFEARLAELAERHVGDPARLAILEALSDWAGQILDTEL